MALERSTQNRPSTRGPARSNSGFVILRFARDFPVAEDQTNLNDLAIALDLPALKDILDQYHLSSTERLIRSATPQQILALEAQAAQTVLAPRRSLARYWRIDARHRDYSRSARYRAGNHAGRGQAAGSGMLSN